MKAFGRKVCAGLLGLLGAVSLGGCEESVQYSYVRVTVSFDPAIDVEVMNKIEGCSVIVEGARSDVAGLQGCTRGKTPRMLGTFDYSTDASSGGTLYFKVIAEDANGEILATATTDGVSIAAGQEVVRTLVLKGTGAPATP